MDELLAKLQEWLTLYGLNIIGAVVIFLVGRWLAKLLSNLLRRILTKSKVEPSLVSFACHFTYIALLTFVIIAALGRLGVQTASFVVVVGAAGLAVGFALQGSLANFAAGVLLIIFKPVKIDDFVEAAGITGTVEQIQLFTTQLRTPDNKTAIIPNAKLTADSIINYSAKGTRRVDLVVGVAYGENLKKVREILKDILANDDRILLEPEPTIAVLALADSSVNFAVRPWVEASDYWGVYFDTLESVKTRFDSEGIVIPFPQRDIHLYR